MKYLRKFENKDNVVEFIYDGGWLDPNIPNVEYSVDNDKVYYSGVYGMDDNTLRMPPGYVELAYVGSTGGVTVDFSEIVFDEKYVLNIIFSEETAATSQIISNVGTKNSSSVTSFAISHNATNDKLIVSAGENGSLVNTEIYNDDILNTKLSCKCYMVATGLSVNYNGLFIGLYNLNSTEQNNAILYGNISSADNIASLNSGITNPHIRLFNNSFKGRIYGASFGHNRGGTYFYMNYDTFDIIPAKRLSDNKVGFIQIKTERSSILHSTATVTKTFIAPSSGTLIAGNIIDLNI